jgi:hypothetical protein
VDIIAMGLATKAALFGEPIMVVECRWQLGCLRPPLGFCCRLIHVGRHRLFREFVELSRHTGKERNSETGLRIPHLSFADWEKLSNRRIREGA